jgi:hypothetical protein
MVNRIPTYSLALILAGLALLIPPEMLAGLDPIFFWYWP